MKQAIDPVISSQLSETPELTNEEIENLNAIRNQTRAAINSLLKVSMRYCPQLERLCLCLLTKLMCSRESRMMAFWLSQQCQLFLQNLVAKRYSLKTIKTELPVYLALPAYRVVVRLHLTLFVLFYSDGEPSDKSTTKRPLTRQH